MSYGAGARLEGVERVEAGLPEPFGTLARLGDEGWRDFRASAGSVFHRLIPADVHEAYAALSGLAGTAGSFLELGSGLGVITIMADLLGFEAYGIEIEPELVTLSEDLATGLSSSATFVEGSFVPPDYRDEVTLLDGDFLTITEGADAYADLGLELADFDLVYAYPWPGEESWMDELVARYAGPRTRLLTYSPSEGFTVASAAR